MDKITDIDGIIDVVAAIEQNYPINDWTIDGVCMWPLIRFRIVNMLNASMKGSSRERRGNRMV